MIDLVPMHEKWEADGMRERMYDHPYLNEASVVFEIGAYKGLWTSVMVERYNPYMYVFEPVKEFFLECSQKFAMNPKVLLLNIGLGAGTRLQEIWVNEDASGISCKEGKHTAITIVDIREYLESAKFPGHFPGVIDLAQINCEGAEYELLDNLLEYGLIRMFKNLQIQFHWIDSDSQRKMENIWERLSVTHDKVYSYPYIFDHWRLK
jgi:FkbM family methyltransferase